MATSSTSRASTARLVSAVGLWPLRALWLAVPAVTGVGIGATIDRFDDPAPIVIEAALWAGWFIGLVASLAPTAASLTALRMVSPALVFAPLLIGIADGDWPTGVIMAIGYGAVVATAAFLPVVGDRMVNGSAYGSERRMTLRPPGFALLGPIELGWSASFGSIAAAVWLLAGGWWAGGAVVAIGAAAITTLVVRSLHQLARRWVVFVPAGFVLHDHVVPAESILLRRSIVASLGPATAPLDDDTVDLSGGARGLVLEVALTEPVPFALRADGALRATEATRLAFTPTLPGAVLAEARVRAIKIGAAGPD